NAGGQKQNITVPDPGRPSLHVAQKVGLEYITKARGCSIKERRLVIHCGRRECSQRVRAAEFSPVELPLQPHNPATRELVVASNLAATNNIAVGFRAVCGRSRSHADLRNAVLTLPRPSCAHVGADIAAGPTCHRNRWWRRRL